MKFSTVKHAFIKIFSDRNVQLTLALFGVGLLLALTATYPALEERVDEDTLEPEDGVTRIKARLPEPYNKTRNQSGLDRIQQPLTGLKNASLELRSETDTINASVRILDRGEIPIKSWLIENGEDKVINMTKYQDAEYIEFEVREGRLSYTYTVNHYIQPYSYLSIPAFILMWISVIFLIRAIALVGPLQVDEKERDRIRNDQKVIDKILSDKKEKK